MVDIPSKNYSSNLVIFLTFNQSICLPSAKWLINHIFWTLKSKIIIIFIKSLIQWRVFTIVTFFEPGVFTSWITKSFFHVLSFEVPDLEFDSITRTLTEQKSNQVFQMINTSWYHVSKAPWRKSKREKITDTFLSCTFYVNIWGRKQLLQKVSHAKKNSKL